MFFRPTYRSRKRNSGLPFLPGYYRSGFRLRGNTLVLLLVFFLIGLFLHYGGETKPVVAFWNDLKGLVGLRSERSAGRLESPYRTPEPEGSDEEATASGSDGNRMETQPGARFDFEKEVDFILPAMKTSDDIIRHDGYTLRYREAFEQADWVAYPLLATDVFGEADRDKEQFKPDPLVKTRTALPSDYSRSGYDRGHLAPAGDFKFSQRLTQESFYMSNMSPQKPDFNRGIWKELEEQVRAWAVRDKGLYVVTGPVLKPGLPTIGRKNKVAVPEQYYKVILYCRNPEIRMIGFLLSNEGSDLSLKNFVVPVDQIEKLTGINFFPKIPDTLERKLERTSSKEAVRQWFSF